MINPNAYAEKVDDVERLSRENHSLKELLRDWIKNPVVCYAISNSCLQKDLCNCLYCQTKRLI